MSLYFIPYVWVLKPFYISLSAYWYPREVTLSLKPLMTATNATLFEFTKSISNSYGIWSSLREILNAYHCTCA